jgi:glycosyltransferase involved in cell wall biosynthesis
MAACQSIDIAIFRSTDVELDSRLNRTIKTFGVDFHIDLVTWARKYKKSDITHLHPLNRSHRYGAGLRGIWPHALWQIHIIYQLFRLKPKVVWAVDLDSAVFVKLYSVIYRKPFVFEQYDPISSRKTFTKLGSWLESKIIKSADIVIFPDKHRIPNFGVKGEIFVIENFEFEVERHHQGPDPDQMFIATYVGTISDDRHLLEVQEAIKLSPKWKLKIWGSDDSAIIERLNPQIEYLGAIPSELRMNCLQDSSAIVAFYSNNSQHNQLTASNKLFEAASAMVPILTNQGTNLAKTVEDLDLGYVAGEADPDMIASTLNLIEIDIKEGISYQRKQRNLSEFELQKKSEFLIETKRLKLALKEWIF